MKTAVKGILIVMVMAMSLTFLAGCIFDGGSDANSGAVSDLDNVGNSTDDQSTDVTSGEELGLVGRWRLEDDSYIYRAYEFLEDGSGAINIDDERIRLTWIADDYILTLISGQYSWELTYLINGDTLTLTLTHAGEETVRTFTRQ